jgi:hypothetical protein
VWFEKSALCLFRRIGGRSRDAIRQGLYSHHIVKGRGAGPVVKDSARPSGCAYRVSVADDPARLALGPKSRSVKAFENLPPGSCWTITR